MSLKSLNNLPQRAVRSLVWVFSMHIFDRGLWFVKTIVLTRFLLPSDFGLMGLALLAVFIFELFSQVGGFYEYLIQKGNKIDRYLNVLWTIQLLQGLLFALISFLLAPWVADFFKMPELKNILQVISLGFVFAGLTNAQVIFFRKDLMFDKEFAYMISGALIDAVMTIIMAVLLHNVWAMVIGFLAGSFTKMVVSYILRPYWPKLVFVWQYFKDMFHFGKWIFLYRLIYFSNTKGMDLFVGRVLNATSLGLYQMSYRFSGAIGLEFAVALNKVTFPTYSKVKDFKDLVAAAYLKAIKFSACFSFPLGITFFVLAPELIKVFFGNNWLNMVHGFRVFAVLGLILPILSTGDALFMSRGKPRLVVLINTVKLFFIFIIALPLTHRYDITGAAWAVLIGNILVIPLWLQISFREIGQRIWELGRIFGVIVTSGIFMVLVMWQLEKWLSPLAISELVFIIFFGLAIFMLSLWLFGKWWHCRIVEELELVIKNLH